MTTPKKIYMAVYCDNDEQAIAVQNIAKEASSAFTIHAVDIMGIYPMIKKNRGLLKDFAKAMSKEGKKGAIKLIPALIKALM
jgi:hypothetical protein